MSESTFVIKAGSKQILPNIWNLLIRSKTHPKSLPSLTHCLIFMCWLLWNFCCWTWSFDHAWSRKKDYPHADLARKLWTFMLNHVKEIVISELLNQIPDQVSIGKDHEPCCICDLFASLILFWNQFLPLLQNWMCFRLSAEVVVGLPPSDGCKFYYVYRNKAYK
jgi:hypothetical protein